jgi:hypothetical protein
VAFAIQIGRSELLTPTHVEATALRFDFSVRIDCPARRYPEIVGVLCARPPAARFVYVDSGARAGQAASCWDRRAKLPLTAVTWALIDSVRRQRSGRLEARIVGIARDGGPACATVPLVEGGWCVNSASSRIAKEVSLPPGSYIEFAGEAQAQCQSERDLLVNSVIAFVGIVLLLSFVTRNGNNLLQEKPSARRHGRASMKERGRAVSPFAGCSPTSRPIRASGTARLCRQKAILGSARRSSICQENGRIAIPRSEARLSPVQPMEMT